MTRDEIMTMEPGRELDVAVAKARGWNITRLLGFNCGGEQQVHYYDIDRGCAVPYYSTNVAAAWDLVVFFGRLVSADGEEYSVALFVNDDDRNEVEIMRDEDSAAWVGGRDATKTMSEAICKAYLLAVTQCN